MKREEKKEFYTLSDEKGLWFLASPEYSPSNITDDVYEAREFSTEQEAVEYCDEYSVKREYRNLTFVSVKTEISRVKKIEK